MKILSALFLTATLLAGPAHADREQDREKVSREVAAERLDLALSLINALDQKFVCETDAYPAEINRIVNQAWYNAAEEKKAEFLAKIPATSAIRADLSFRIAVKAYDIYDQNQTVEKFTAALIGTKHFRFGQGAYGSQYNVTLLAGGVAAERTLELLENEPWFRWVDSTNSWSVRKIDSDETVPFLVKIGGTEFRVELKDGVNEIWLIPVGVKEGDPRFYNETLSTSDSYCDA